MEPPVARTFCFTRLFNRKKVKVRNHLYQRLRTFVVRVTGLEPAHLAAQEPKSCVSASFTTPAYVFNFLFKFYQPATTGIKYTLI